LLSVQYMADPVSFEPDKFFANMDTAMLVNSTNEQQVVDTAKTPSVPRSANEMEFDSTNATAAGDEFSTKQSTDVSTNTLSEMDGLTKQEEHDAALEAALEHARQVGVQQGMTRAMVIRAYPQPWHVFVDTSPDTDADYEVAATFADEPDINQVNNAIVECLEGSELEDELVAQQMQQALELGQLDRISEMLSSMGLDEDEDDDDPYSEMFGDDTV
jgi:hypothetical protein